MLIISFDKIKGTPQKKVNENELLEKYVLKKNKL